MGYNNGIVTDPVSVYDIRNAVGHSSGDLGTLILNGTINIWAKYKPVQKAIVDTTPQLNSNKTWNTGVSNPWWKGVLNDYGLAYAGGQVSINNYSMVDALTTLATKINGGMNGWTYLRPSGGSNGPYRYLDFNRYNRNAPNPVRNMRSEDVTASSTSVYTVLCDYIASGGATPVSGRDYIIPEDVIGSNYVLSMAVFKKSGSTYIPIAWVTDSKTWEGLGINSSSGSDGIISSDSSVAITKLKSGSTYYVLPFFCDVSLTQPQAGYSRQVQNNGKHIVTIPYTNFVSFTATQRSTSTQVAVPKITNKQITVGGYLSTVVQLDSTEAGYVGGTASNVTLQVVNENYNGTIAQGNYALYEQLGNISVGADEVKNIYTISNLALDYLNHTWRVMVSVNGYWTTISLMAPRDPFA